MTIDEAIKHTEKIAEKYESDLKVYENLDEDRSLFKEEENSCKKCVKEHRQVAEWLKELKTLREQTRWIPASERLPKVNEYVGNVCKYYLVQNEFGDMLVATYTNNGWIPINTMQALEYDVVAWMSLPELYRAESESYND